MRTQFDFRYRTPICLYIVLWTLVVETGEIRGFTLNRELTRNPARYIVNNLFRHLDCTRKTHQNEQTLQVRESYTFILNILYNLSKCNNRFTNTKMLAWVQQYNILHHYDNSWSRTSWTSCICFWKGFKNITYTILYIYNSFFFGKKMHFSFIGTCFQ